MASTYKSSLFQQLLSVQFPSDGFFIAFFGNIGDGVRSVNISMGGVAAFDPNVVFALAPALPPEVTAIFPTPSTFTGTDPLRLSKGKAVPHPNPYVVNWTISGEHDPSTPAHLLVGGALVAFVWFKKPAPYDLPVSFDDPAFQGAKVVGGAEMTFGATSGGAFHHPGTTSPIHATCTFTFPTPPVHATTVTWAAS